ncbi:MAG: hypothetical protein WD052_08685 [Bacteroidales bacterium]
MKTKNSLVSIALILFMSVTVMAQKEHDVIAVVNEAAWCSVCKSNGERAMATFKENNKEGTIKFVANDLTNDETKKKSAAKLKKYGLTEAMAGNKGTGMTYFFNAETKELITTVSVAKSDKVLAETVSSAKKAVK